MSCNENEFLVFLGSSSVNVNDGSEDSEFRNAIRVLADRVGNLAQQRAELLERCNIAETNQAHLKRDLENQAELLKSLYSKRKFDKQVQLAIRIPQFC